MNEKLDGETLGAAQEGDSEDWKSWIKRTKQGQKRLATKQKKGLENEEQPFEEKYTEGTA